MAGTGLRSQGGKLAAGICDTGCRRWNDLFLVRKCFWFVMAAFVLILAPVMLLGCLVAAGFGVFAVGRISHMSDLGGPAGRIGAIARRITVNFK